MATASSENVSDRAETLFDQRPFLADGFLLEKPKQSNVTERTSEDIKWDASVSELRFDEQEAMLIDDLLYAMQGIEGEHIIIRSTSSGPQCLINPHFDESVRELAGRILVICEDYHCIIQYVESIDASRRSGIISQALAASARTILDEYNLYVTQLEDGQMNEDLSLQKMWYHVQPLQHVLNALADSFRFIQERNIRGGALLSFLHSKRDEFIGDTKVREMFVFLLSASAKPFFFNLERWIYHGELLCNHDEFMIVENVEEKERHPSGVAFDQITDWERRYEVNDSMCPSFLLSVADKVLSSGKYLNIIYSCGRKVETASHSTLEYSPYDRRYLKTIEDAYAEAGRTLVSLLIDGYGLLNTLRSLKHYFLMDRGDWLLHFIEVAETELTNAVEDIMPHRIRNFLGLAFNLSSVAQNPLKDSIKFEFMPHALTSDLLEIIRIKGGSGDAVPKSRSGTRRRVGFDSFALRYDAEWPLSIIFNHDVMFKYQIMFRQILTFKNIERQLSRAWISYRSDSQQALLLHKLISFVRRYLYSLSVDVIEPYWHQFVESVSQHRGDRRGMFTLDDLLQEHSSFQDRCLEDMLLTEEPLIICMDKIVELCKEVVISFDVAAEEIDVDFMDQEYTATVEDLLAQLRTLSNSRKEKSWLDLAYGLGLITV